MTRKHRIVLTGLILFTVGLVGVVISVLKVRQTAYYFLSEASALTLGSSQAQVLQLVRQYGGRSESAECDLDACSYVFSFDNRWLHRLRLAPYTRLTCSLGTGRGILVSRRTALVSGDTPGAFGAFVDERYSGEIASMEPDSKSFLLNREAAGKNSEVRWRVHIRLTPLATQAQRRMAYDLNVGCLSRIGGCEDAQRLLPSVSWGDQSMLKLSSSHGTSP